MQASTEKFSLGKFLKEVRAELKKVHWPTKKELGNYTTTVLITVTVVAVLIYLLDKGILGVLGMIMGS